MEHDVSRSCVVFGPTSWRGLQHSNYTRLRAKRIWKSARWVKTSCAFGVSSWSRPKLNYPTPTSYSCHQISIYHEVATWTPPPQESIIETGSNGEKQKLILSDLDRRLSSIAFMTCRGRVSSGGSLGRLDDCLSKAGLIGWGRDVPNMPPKNRKQKKFDSYLIIFDADLMICGILCKHEIPCHDHPTSQFQMRTSPFRLEGPWWWGEPHAPFRCWWAAENLGNVVWCFIMVLSSW